MATHRRPKRRDGVVDAPRRYDALPKWGAQELTRLEDALEKARQRVQSLTEENARLRDENRDLKEEVSRLEELAEDYRIEEETSHMRMRSWGGAESSDFSEGAYQAGTAAAAVADYGSDSTGLKGSRGSLEA